VTYSSATLPDTRPRLRGVLHVWAFFASLVAGTLLVLVRRGPLPWPALVYASSVTALLGTSALYHRVAWSPPWYSRMRRLDHAMIFVLILGTYTPIFLITLKGHGRGWLFASVCAVAAIGVLITMFWTAAPKWARAAVYLAVGWMSVLVLPDLARTIGWSGLAMMALGGGTYTVGAIVYAIRRPDPWPDVFGYHEIFHALVITAAAIHFAMIAFWVVPT